MTFNWIDYLVLSEKLNTDNANQAEMRTSISRAYYCAYHKARVLCVNKLGVNSQDFKGASSHKVVIEKLKFSSDPELLDIGVRLNALKLRREDADYELSVTFKTLTVNDAISKAKAIIELITNYNP
jgi:uncharacterized protein (UPF0332 family)